MTKKNGTLSEHRRRSRPVKRLVIGFFAFVLIWSAAWFTADRVWEIEVRAYSMLWGWLAGTFGLWISKMIEGQ